MNTVDLLFIIDITGSMDHLIESAKNKMRDILNDLTTKYQLDLKVGLSLYRDHPSQDSSFVTAVFNLMDVDAMMSRINEVQVGGGGDYPEAVLDGIIDGIEHMDWRDGSRRISFLIGDAPPHGMCGGESCCLCGKTWGDAVQAAEDNQVVIYSIELNRGPDAMSAFKTLSNFTGGILVESTDAMGAILSTLSEVFDGMNLDSKVMEMLSKDYDQDQICDMLNIDRGKLSESKGRIALST